MYRKDREITDFEKMMKIIERSKSLRIALVDDDRPYILPMSFGQTNENGILTIYLHGAGKGKKLDLIRKNNNIAFEVDFTHEIVKNEKPEKWTAKYESVIGYGKAFILEDIKEKAVGLDAIMRQYGFKGIPSYPNEMLESMAVVRIDVAELTAKSNM